MENQQDYLKKDVKVKFKNQAELRRGTMMIPCNTFEPNSRPLAYNMFLFSCHNASTSEEKEYYFSDVDMNLFVRKDLEDAVKTMQKANVLI